MMSYNKTLWIDDETIITAERMNKIEDCLEKNTTDFNSHIHVKSEIVDFPKSMPASGGNSDTVNNKRVNDDATDNMSLWTASKIGSEISKLESAIQIKLDGKSNVHNHPFAPSMHSHTRSEILDFDHLHSVSSITDFPSSMPANGGNADTVDGKHASDFATASHTHNNIVSRGNVTMETGANSRPAVSGISMTQVYNNGYPTTYGNIISLGGQGDGQLLIGWSGSSGAHAPVYVRSRRDTTDADWSEWAQLYSTVYKPTAADVGAFPLTGGILNGYLRASGEIISTSANALRASYGNYGFFIRQDGANTYFMFTNSGDPYGTWNSLRPITIVNSSGNVSCGHSFSIGNSNGNVKRTTISSASPSGGLNGDVWLKYS